MQCFSQLCTCLDCVCVRQLQHGRMKHTLGPWKPKAAEGLNVSN